MSTTRRDEPGACIDLFVREVRDDERDRTTLSSEYRRCPTLDEQELRQCRAERVRWWRRPAKRRGR